MLLLDVMGTLVYDPFPHEVPAFFGMTLEELYAAKHPTAWKEFERGEIDEAGLAARYFEGGLPCDVVGFRETLAGAYRWLDGVEALLSDLRDAGVDMHVLSNYPTWYRQIEKRLGLSRYLPWTFVSCETGVRKPAHQAYLGAAERLGLEPGRCLFVDDRAKNCEGAEAVGMQSIVFAGAEALRADLRAIGIL